MKNAQGDIWISEAFPSDAATEVLEGLKGVINDPNGTGWGAHREDILLAGKTGTAELKATKEKVRINQFLSSVWKKM